MSVLIRGMEMPDYGYVCLKVFANGEVLMTKEARGSLVITGIRDKVGTAVPVLPHGRLIDADELMGVIRAHDYPLKAHFNSTDNGMFTIGIQQAVDEAPTIIPAEEGET